MLTRTCLALISHTFFDLQAAEKLAAPRLIEMARQKSPDLGDALRASVGEEQVKKGTAFAGEGPDFIWAFESDAQPVLYVDDRPLGPMTRASGVGNEHL